MDVIHFLTLDLRRISFSMNFLLLEQEKISNLCIELNLSGTDLILQLKISHR